MTPRLDQGQLRWFVHDVPQRVHVPAGIPLDPGRVGTETGIMSIPRGVPL
ncbi:MAG: hypothetical protein AVDCRST_MAG75-704 [uncultured Propionibacteriaceae bacterium]|uniref:Uncharacterized protein n=1 Tax=uncultured Propionibacteriaceae bacterium TaxID=257457 RepID=A0A6J4N9M0_9ACTN|nr:MAG: hypothetical protein AVDCRST_MAG75-704 [uncultured Propionibacteriaceae bacterium]